MLNAAIANRINPPGQKKFHEVEIKDFRGLATANRNPQKNECTICKNFDLREITGELTSRQGYRRKYAAPTLPASLTNVTYLRATNFVVVRNGVEKEITLLMGKGTLARVSGSGASETSINIGLFWIRPYFDGSAWQDSWLWLNESYLTTISGQGSSGSDYNRFNLYGDFNSTAEYFRKWSIYSITQSKYSELYESTYVSATVTQIRVTAQKTADATNLANSDTVLVMRNFIPYNDLKEYYNVTGKEISFHNVLNSLRIGFGGYANRLGLYIGYLKTNFLFDNSGGKFFNGGTLINTVKYDEIVLLPYNSLTEDTKASGDWTITAGTPPADANVFHLYGDESDASATENWFARLTVVLDDYQEFLIPFWAYRDSLVYTVKGVVDWSYNADITAGGGDTIAFQFRFFWGLFNKRIRKIRLYMGLAGAYNNPAGGGPYYRVKEWDVALDTYISSDYDLNDQGYMYNVTPYTFNKTEWDARGQELSLSLNYGSIPVNTGGIIWSTGEYRGIDYARGWDCGVSAEGRPFIANPYADNERIMNMIFYSPFSGAGAPLHDVFQGGEYIDVDSHDGNTLVALGVLPNFDVAAFKTNNITAIRTNTAQVRDVAFGYGLETQRSIVNFGDRLGWASQQDLFDTTGATVRNLSEAAIRDTYRGLSSANKQLVFATREELDNSYRFKGPSTFNEYLLTPKGWVYIVQNVLPTDYLHSTDDTLWFMSDGVIYYQTAYADANSSDTLQDIALQWKSVLFDLAQMGEGLIQSDRFWIDGVFLKYSSSSNLTMNVYLDDTLFDTITFSSSLTYDDPAIKIGGVARTIQIEITGATQSKVTISSIGFRFRSILRGNRV